MKYLDGDSIPRRTPFCITIDIIIHQLIIMDKTSDDNKWIVEDKQNQRC